MTWCAAALAVGLLRLLFATCRRVYHAPDPKYRLDSLSEDPERFILCVWHDGLIIPTFGTRRVTRERACSLVSRHQDGTYLADAMALLGFRTVRGSTNKGGAQALRQLITDTEGLHINITPDGPRGPRREVKPGIVYLASQTGRRILVTAFTCDRGWRIRGSWTDALLPYPFTTVHLWTGGPLTIPPDLSRDALAAEVARVQQAMDDLNAEAEGRPLQPAAVPLRHAA